MKIRPFSGASGAGGVPETFSGVATPGLMLSQAYPTSRDRRGETVKGMREALAETDFFRALQIVDVPHEEERKELAVLIRESGHPMTYTLTRHLAEQGLNLADLDRDKRKRACRAAVEKVMEARDLGAQTVGLVSGPRPEDPEKRAEGLVALEESLGEVCAAAKEMGGITILIEPLDTDAHKKFTLGTAVEGVKIARSLEKSGLRLALCLDTAHLLLNGEDVVEAVVAARDYIDEFHFCNCVTDTKHPLHGDRHLPFGPPGIVDRDTIGKLMAGLYRKGFFNPVDRPKVFCEVLQQGEMSSLDDVRHCRDALEGGWKAARSILAS